MKTLTQHGHCGHGTDRSSAQDQRSSGPCRVRCVRAVSASSCA